jgi:hypothetical protein
MAVRSSALSVQRQEVLLGISGERPPDIDVKHHTRRKPGGGPTVVASGRPAWI